MKNSNINNPLHVEAVINEPVFSVCLCILNIFIPITQNLFIVGSDIKYLTFRNWSTDVIKHTFRTESILIMKFNRIIF